MRNRTLAKHLGQAPSLVLLAAFLVAVCRRPPLPPGPPPQRRCRNRQRRQNNGYTRLIQDEHLSVHPVIIFIRHQNAGANHCARQEYLLAEQHDEA